jgi:DNA-binding HxlR family transcriptional regulator
MPSRARGQIEAYRLLNDLSRAWMLPLLHALGQGRSSRFNELKKKLDGISPTCLAQRLRELEAMGLVRRVVHPDQPPRVEYALTKRGAELHKAVCGLVEWANA